jgi:hypothetical protein
MYGCGPSWTVGGASLVDLRDPGVLQRPQHLGLALEAAQQARAGEVAPDHLEGDLALGLRLLGQVDGAHAALAQQREHAVAAHGGGERPGGRREGGGQRDPEAGAPSGARGRARRALLGDAWPYIIVPVRTR